VRSAKNFHETLNVNTKIIPHIHFDIKIHNVDHTSQLKRTKREKKSAVHINVYPYRRFRLLDVLLQLGRHLAKSDHSL